MIEMINRLDDETLMDSEGRQNLVSKLNSYSEELYRDALTGVFNRRYFEDQIRDASFCCGVAMIDLDDFCDISRRAFSEIQLRHGIALFHTV